MVSPLSCKEGGGHGLIHLELQKEMMAADLSGHLLVQADRHCQADPLRPMGFTELSSKK